MNSERVLNPFPFCTIPTSDLLMPYNKNQYVQQLACRIGRQSRKNLHLSRNILTLVYLHFDSWVDRPIGKPGFSRGALLIFTSKFGLKRLTY